jgi:hypothetical protein
MNIDLIACENGGLECQMLRSGRKIIRGLASSEFLQFKARAVWLTGYQ